MTLQRPRRQLNGIADIAVGERSIQRRMPGLWVDVPASDRSHSDKPTVEVGFLDAVAEGHEKEPSDQFHDGGSAKDGPMQTDCAKQPSVVTLLW